MLDVVRHFMTVAEVKRYLDHMTLYKLNRLHLHLSDDQGWRLQIKGWPRLTTYGATTEVGNGPGGFYTQAQYSSIVRYAAKRFITVIPEIDTPAHTNAALASYPRLNCDGQAPPLYTGIEVGFSSLCIGKAVTYRFLDDVVRQLARLTPGRYLDLGGDEAHSTPHADYVRFIEKLEPIVRRHGKRMMGWAETSAAHLSGTGLAEYWNPATGSDAGTETATNAAAQGVGLVMSPASKAYLDMKYTELTPMGQSWAGIVEVSDSYDWDPVTFVSGIKESDVTGVEAPVWTETLKDLRDVEYMAFPRLPGVAEKGWSPARHPWSEYRTRLATQSPRWEVMGVNYYCSPQVDWRYCRTNPTAPGAQ
jgi:hexosaminidase